MPDPAFEKSCTIGSSVAACIVIASFRWIVILILLPYWIAPYLIAAGYTSCPSIPVIGFCILMHTLGVAIMMVSGIIGWSFFTDAQKYYTLQYRKGLITDGMFKYIRSPNYLGEVMIYASYAIVANVCMIEWVTIVALASMACINLRLVKCFCYPYYYKRKAHGKVYSLLCNKNKTFRMGRVQESDKCYSPYQVHSTFLSTT